MENAYCVIAGFLNAQLKRMDNFWAKNLPHCETIILAKDDFISMIATAINEDGGEILITDLRQPFPMYASFATPEEAEEKFFKALQTSKERGWRVVHRGERNWG